MPLRVRPLSAPVPAALAWLDAARRCRVAIGVLALLTIGLLASPQTTDLLITLGQGGGPGAWGALAAGAAWLSVNAWFWTHLFLSPGAAGARLLPAALAAAAFAIVAAGLQQAADGVPASMAAEMGAAASGAGRLRIAAALCLLAACAAFALIRLDLLPAARGRAATTAMAALSCAVAAAGLAAYGSDPVAAARLLPPGATLLFAASGMICGGTLLARAGARTRAPILLLVFLAAGALAAARDRDALPDNHDVRRLPGAPRARPDLRTAFRAFLDAAAPDYPAAPIPVVLAAASGGGLAASYWTATVLEDLAAASPEFARQVFAVSGVSGGALGALAYVAARGEPGCPARRACARAALSEDFLGPLLGALLYPDLLQRFLPALVFEDRQTALEQAWEARWRAVFGDDRLAGPFLDLWAPGRPWPALFLNGTSLATGGRLVTSNLAAEEPDQDLLAAMGAEVRASTAAGDSARFPYLSPLGTVRDAAGRRVDAVGDGGYFENLGAATLLDVLDALDETARADGRAVRFAVIQIVTDTDVGPDGEAAPRDPGADSRTLLPAGLTGPAAILLRTRAARGAQAAAALARRVAALGGSYVPVRLGRSPTGETAPLGWSLSAAAREVIGRQWTPACRGRLLDSTGFGAGPGEDMSAMSVPAMWQASRCALAQTAVQDVMKR